MDQQPLDETCESLGEAAQAALLRRLLPILDEQDLPLSAKNDLLEEINVVKRRYSRLPKNDFAFRKSEVTELLVSFKKCAKLRRGQTGVREKNEIINETLWSIVSWVKQLWITGVEFGQELELVHESLGLCQGLIVQWRDSSNDCVCILGALDMSFKIKRSDGVIVESFAGPAGVVVPKALRFVWKNVLLAHLAKPLNASDQCVFVTQRAPSILRDIMHLSGLGAHSLISLIDEGAAIDLELDAGDEEDEGEDDWESEGDGDMEVEDEEEDDDEIPPLIDITGTSDQGTSNPIYQASVSPDSSDDELPPLIDIHSTQQAGRASGSSEIEPTPEESLPHSKAPPNPSPNGELNSGANHDLGEDSDDCSSTGPRSTDDLGKDALDTVVSEQLDEEEDERLEEEYRLEDLIRDFLVNNFRHSPALGDYFHIARYLPNLKPKLVNHLAKDMIHTEETFFTAVRIFVRDGNTTSLRLLHENNDALAAKLPAAMQQVAKCYASSASLSTRNMVGPLILKQLRSLLQDMRVEIEIAFRGLLDPVKKAVLVEELLSMPTSPTRIPAFKAWVTSVLTPRAESLSTSTAGPQDGDDEDDQALDQDPFGILAGLSALFGMHPPPQHGPVVQLHVDPVAALGDLPPTDDDMVQIRSIYRPSYAAIFDSWMQIIDEVGSMESTKCGNIKFRLCLDIVEMFPFLRTKVAGLAEEMIKSLSDEPSRLHVSDTIKSLGAFVKQQQKIASAQKAKKAKASARKERSTGITGSSGAVLNPTSTSLQGSSTTPITNSPTSMPSSAPTVQPAVVNGANPFNTNLLSALMHMTFPLSAMNPNDPSPPSALDDVD